MHTAQNANFWRRTPAPARPALLATLVVMAVGLVSFVLLVWAESAYFGLSPVEIVFAAPRPGAPSVWLGMVLLAVAFQGAATLALRQRAIAFRAVGTVIALAITLLCLLFVVAGAFSLVNFLTAGILPGDFSDLLGILLFGVPLALIVGGLNARAFLLEIRELFQ
jgi:hypothetical protein